MEWKPTKNPIGNKAQIFANGKDGGIYYDEVVRIFKFGLSLNNLMEKPEEHLMCIKRHSGIHNVCAFWVEDGQWHPILELNYNGSWCVCEDYVTEDIVNRIGIKYIERQFDDCLRLVEIVRNDEDILGGDA